MVQAIGPIPDRLDDLTDVNAPTPADQDRLVWDQASGKWVPQHSTFGTGDMLSTNNLSDVADVPTARANLGLGTAATYASTDFADASHTHPSSDITDLTEVVQDIVGAMLVAGANVSSVVYDDTAGTATINVAGLSTEAVQDIVGTFTVAGANVTVTYDDTANTLTIASTGGGGGSVTDVAGTAPIVSSGGTTPAISISAATTGAAGSMSAADKVKVDALGTASTHAAGDFDAAGAAASVDADLLTHEALTTTAHGGIVASTDSRLTDSRTPTAHHTTHVTGGSDVIADAVAAGASGLLSGADKTKLDNTTGVNSGDQDLSGKVDKNTAITGATKTKISYDTKGLVTAGADATTADIADSTNKRYVTDAELTVLGNTSGVNTGDQSVPAFATPSVTLGTAAAAGSAGTVIRSDATVVAFDTTAPSTQAYGDSAAVGTATVAARRDHKHAMPAVASDATLTTTDITTNDVSISKHGFAPKAPNDATKFLDGTGAYSTPAGGSFATPAIALGTAAAAGSASTGIRSDSTIVAFDTTAPVTQAYGDAAAVGTATVAARRDHKHGMPAAMVLYGTLASLPAASLAGRIYMCTDDDFEFVDTGSDWQIFWRSQYIGLQSAVPLTSSFTHTLTAGSGGTMSDTKAGLRIVQAAGGGGDAYDLWSVALPSTTGPWTVTMFVRPDLYIPKRYSMIVLALLTAAAGSDMHLFGLSSTSPFNPGTAEYNSSSTAVTGVQGNWTAQTVDGIWLRIHDDGAASGTSRSLQAGKTLSTLYTPTTRSHTWDITAARVGILLNARNADAPVTGLSCVVPYWSVINS